MIHVATDPDQSARLIACGVDEASADMVWTTWENDDEKLTQLSVMSEYAYEMGCLNPIPAWSLSVLFALLPHSVKADSIEYYKEITAGWRVSYAYYDDILICFDAHDLIECCVTAIEWLTQNGYKLNDIQV